ncbi:uncharacterized protein ACRADG_012588 [Cochliomyia hominivorax]
MFTEQAVVHASQSLTSLTLNTNTTQSPNQNQYQQPKKLQHDKYNFHYHQQTHHYHSPHHSSASTHQQQNAQQHNHNFHRQNKQVHTLPSSLPTSMESSISRRNSIIEHCSCGLTFKVDKNTNNIITSSTSLLTLNTIYNENPTLIDQANNQGSLTQSQNILQDDKNQRYQRSNQTQQHQSINKYQHHAHHCHHYQQTSSSSIGTTQTVTVPVTIPRYKPSEPPEIHTHEYFSQESHTQDHTTTITNTTAVATTTPHTHSCRHSHVHAQTDFSYSQR